MQDVEAVCDRVVIINRGKIVADAPTRELQLLNLTNRIIKAEFNQPVDFEQIKEIKGVVEVQKENETTVRIFVNSDDDLRARVFKLAVEKNWILLSMGYEDQTVEQVFRKLTFNA